MKLSYFLNGQSYLSNEIRNFQAEEVFLTKGLQEGRISQEAFETRKAKIREEIERLHREIQELIDKAYKEKLFEIKLCDLYNELKSATPNSNSKDTSPKVFISQKNNIIRIQVYTSKNSGYTFYTNRKNQNLASDKKYQFPFPYLSININPASTCLQDEYFGKAIISCVKNRENQLEADKKKA